MMIPWRSPGEHLAIRSISTNENLVEVTIQPTTRIASCPYCHRQSERIHSHYKRQIQDLPVGEQSIKLCLFDRKWLCDFIDCTTHIFTERFTWLKPYSRRTERLTNVLRKLAFSMSCLNAEKIAHVLPIFISHDTLLVILRETSIETKVPKVIGLDDFAFKKGNTYGTIIYDAISHNPIAILPDRVMETVRDWLKQFPQIQIVSRDGSYAFKDAITQANPKIKQIIDRWHVLKNGKDALIEWLKTTIPATVKWIQLAESVEVPRIKNNWSQKLIKKSGDKFNIFNRKGERGNPLHDWLGIIY